MKRKDLPLFIALIGLLIAWPFIDRHLIRPLFSSAQEPPPPAEVLRDGVPPSDPEAMDDDRPAPVIRDAVSEAPSRPEQEDDASPEPPEAWVVLRNADLEMTLTTHGAGISSVRLLHFPRSMDPDSGPVDLDFDDAPALVYERLPGMGAGRAFEVNASARQAVFRRRTGDGLELVRTFTLEETGYLLRVEDAFLNPTGEPIDVPAHWMRSGPMRSLPGESAMRGVAHLGVDTLSPGGERVQNWGRRIPKLMRSDAQSEEPGGSAVLLDVPLAGRSQAIDWASAKNKYFVQILRPEFGAEGARLIARRESATRNAAVAEVTVALRFGGLRLDPGQTDAVRLVHYYAGPKKLDDLRALGSHQVDVMEFGRLAAVSRVLLRALNLFYRAVPNYGIAIMLLTVLIRIIFWPVTHKSTQSMRRMQEVQPLVQALKDKHKDNPQRQQRELMALYKEHKVNPLGGCLPMLVQIPVFIALFTVLRSAIELRFAPFLWVRDLSEPENLLAGLLPFGLSLNILPLLMTGVQYWQQKLTPTGGDPSQQKMMGMMPFIMLIFFYQFAAGLVLYWTTNQVLMVVQQLLHQRRKKHA